MTAKSGVAVPSSLVTGTRYGRLIKSEAVVNFTLKKLLDKKKLPVINVPIPPVLLELMVPV
jgi:hypothetical protein